MFKNQNLDFFFTKTLHPLFIQTLLYIVTIISKCIILCIGSRIFSSLFVFQIFAIGNTGSLTKKIGKCHKKVFVYNNIFINFEDYSLSWLIV